MCVTSVARKVMFSMGFIRSALFFLVFVGSGLQAQEVRYIEVSSAEQRTELRHPPEECGQGVLGGGTAGGSVVDGAPDQRDPRALGVYLLRVHPTDIDPLQPFEAEFKVLNTGKVAIELPVSPHLADLQPSDESVEFQYFSLTLATRIEPDAHGPDVAGRGYISLYGSRERDGSMLLLRPGEWIRVKANMKLHTWPSESVSARLRGQFWLRRNFLHPKPAGGFTETQNLYPNETPTPSIAVHLLGSTRTEKPRQ
jgi:hypothetical protein